MQCYSWLIFEDCSILSACSFAWLMPGLCLKTGAYTVCRALVPSRDLIMWDLCLKNDVYTLGSALVSSRDLCRNFA